MLLAPSPALEKDYWASGSREGRARVQEGPVLLLVVARKGAVGVGLGQATGPQGNPALWGRVGSQPRIDGVGGRGEHSPASARCPATISSPNPHAGCAVLRSCPTEDRKTGVQGLIKVKQQLGVSVRPAPLLTLINPKMSRALRDPQITLGCTLEGKRSTDHCSLGSSGP